MGESLAYEFDYMCEDTVCSIVSVYKGGTASVRNMTDNLILTAFGKKTSINHKDVFDLLEERCVPASRSNIKEILDSAGLKEYDPMDLIRLTHGVMCDDHFWIRFAEERGKLFWKDVNPIAKIQKVCEDLNNYSWYEY